VIATVDDLEQIAANDQADVAALHGWRRELFGEAALSRSTAGSRLAIEKRPRGQGGSGVDGLVAAAAHAGPHGSRRTVLPCSSP